MEFQEDKKIAYIERPNRTPRTKFRYAAMQVDGPGALSRIAYELNFV